VPSYDAHSRTDRPWTPRITGSRAVTVHEILDDVGRRLFREAAPAPALTAIHDSRLWHPPALANGYPGLALCGLVMAKVFPEQGYRQGAARSAKLAASATQAFSVTAPGMFGGGAGLAFAMEIMARNDERYHASADRIRNQVAELILSWDWSVHPDGLSFSDYDVVTGAAGVLRYLLTARASGRPLVDDAIDVLLNHLVLIATVPDKDGLSGWFVAPELINKEATLAEQCPHGVLDLGLAHGISGILAALAVAWSAGLRVAHQEEGIRRLARCLLDHRKDDEWGVNWPSVIPIAADGSPTPLEHLEPFGSTAWCYGAAGTMRALWLAGRALDDDLLTEAAIEAVQAIMRRPVPSRWGVRAVNLCHGYAGHLAILLRFADETEIPDIDSRIEAAVDGIVSCYSPDHAFGFKNPLGAGELSDDPGLLDGAAGVCMALAAAVSPAAAPDWDRVMLNT
jgi:lantibiotic biosynthesis protein